MDISETANVILSLYIVINFLLIVTLIVQFFINKKKDIIIIKFSKAYLEIRPEKLLLRLWLF